MSSMLKGTVTDPTVIRGKSAYEIAVMHGFEGTEEEWIKSVTAEADRSKAEADRSEAAANSISFHYGVCSTDGATAAKVVSVEGFELKVGAKVTVKFNSTNTVANPTLNVSGTGAYPMIFKGNSIAAYPLFTVGSLEATKLYDFVFTGAGYELVGGLHVDSFADTSKNRNGYVKPTAGGDITWTGGVGTVNRADKAVSDEDGNNIKETYATKKELAEQGNAISVGTNLSGKTVEFSQVNGVSGTGYEVMFKAGDDFEIFSEDDYYQVTKDGVTEGHNTGGINPFSYTFPSDKDYIVSVYDENALSAVVKIENITAAKAVSDEDGNNIKNTYVNKDKITLGLHTDGLVYVFVDGVPIGNGIALPSGVSGDVVGNLDSDNNIILSGNLADGAYTLRYENEDGTYTEIGTLEVGNAVPEPTNLFVVGGDGYIINGRCSSGGADRTDTNGNVVSNYIKVSNGDTVYLNKPISTATGEYSGMKLTDGTVAGFLPSDTAYISNLSTANGITQFTVSNANADYIRLTMNVNYGTAITEADVVNAGIIITVNEPLS